MKEGVVAQEDASLTLNPFLAGQGGQAISAEKNWVAPADGDYSMTLRTADSSQLYVDDKEMLTIFSGSKGVGTAKMFLKKGVHRIRIAT
jgi:hypothetical protein